MIRNKTIRRFKYIPSIPGQRENTFKDREEIRKENSGYSLSRLNRIYKFNQIERMEGG